MKNRVKFFASELFSPIQGGKVFGNNITPIPAQIFEIAGTKIVNHGQPRRRKFLLESQGQVGANEAGPTGDEQIGSGRSHKKGVDINKS